MNGSSALPEWTGAVAPSSAKQSFLEEVDQATSDRLSQHVSMTRFPPLEWSHLQCFQGRTARIRKVSCSFSCSSARKSFSFMFIHVLPLLYEAILFLVFVSAYMTL